MTNNIGALCVCHNLRKAARIVTRHYERSLSKVGLTAGQFTILAALDMHPLARIGVLAKKIGLERTSLTRELQLLQNRHLIRSSHPANDGRVRQLSLTEAGDELYARAHSLWQVEQTKTLGKIDPEEWTQIQVGLQKLTDQLELGIVQ